MKIRKKLMAFTLIIIAFIFVNGKVFASEVENAEIKEEGILKYTGNELMPFYSTSRQANTVINKITDWFLGETLPSSYKTENLTIKDQKSTGECWAFAFTSAIEAYNLKYFGSTDIYSPRHIDYSCSNSFSSGTRKNSYTRKVGEKRGSYDLATAYATSGYGPVLEEDMPFSENLADIPASSLDLEVQKQLESYKLFDSVYKVHNENGISYYSDKDCTIPFTENINEFRKKVKQQIKDNGGVLTCVYEADFSKDLFITDNSLGVSHGVLIIGWDDNYKGEGWKNPGAYIALNSYGVNNFDKGYTYISYDDVYVENGLYGITGVSDVDYTKIYEHDEFGSTAGIGGKSISKNCTQTDEITSINVFDRSSVEDENLTEIGFSSWSYQKAEVYYTESFTDNGLPKEWISLGSAGNVEPGYTTFKLTNPIKLSGEKFAVAVKFTENNEENLATAAFEYKIPGDEWRQNITGKQGESYVVIDKFDPKGSTTYYTVNSNSSILNVCVKAYTRVGDAEDPNSDIKVTDYKMVGKIVTRVPLKTTIADFKTKIICEKTYKIVDSTGKEITSGNMKTGYKVVVNGNEYEVSVISDISGDGEGDILDLARLRSHVVGKSGHVLGGAQFYAADLSLDGNVDILDIARMRKVCVE